MASVTAQRPRLAPDKLLINAILILVAVGVVVVFDSSYARSIEVSNDAFFYLKRQALWAGIGVAVMLIVMRCGYWRLRAAAPWLLLASLVLLAAVWIPGVGKHANGATRWIGFGIFQIQPSEFAKLALIIYLSAYLSRRDCNLRDAKEGLVIPLAATALICLLIDIQPDLGTAFVTGLAALTLLAVGGARARHIAMVIGFALLFFLGSSMRHGYRQERIKVWLQPEAYRRGAGYQTMQGLFAVATGGPTGVGFGKGRGKYYLPEANTDFIYATIVEEMGLWGALLVLGLMGGVGWRAYEIARRTTDPFGMMLATGIGAVITWQALVNVAVVTNTIPATGVPLPFISYGGSSLLFLMLSVGVLLSIARYPNASRRA